MAYISSKISLDFKSISVIIYSIGVMIFVGGRIQVENFILTNIFGYIILLI